MSNVRVDSLNNPYLIDREDPSLFSKEKLLLQTVFPYSTLGMPLRATAFTGSEGGETSAYPKNNVLTFYSNVNLGGNIFSHGLPTGVLEAALPLPTQIGGPFSYSNDDTQQRYTLQLLGNKDWFNMPSELYLGYPFGGLGSSPISYLPADGRLEKPLDLTSPDLDLFYGGQLPGVPLDTNIPERKVPPPDNKDDLALSRFRDLVRRAARRI